MIKAGHIEETMETHKGVPSTNILRTINSASIAIIISLISWIGITLQSLTTNFATLAVKLDGVITSLGQADGRVGKLEDRLASEEREMAVVKFQMLSNAVKDKK